jgi:hypothetical protein
MMDVTERVSVFQLVEEMGCCVIVVGRVWPSSCVVPIKKPLQAKLYLIMPETLLRLGRAGT